ncbi:MAG TPA: response regulator [Steroidobacteraceae bacterium]|nr:response regulator [Steroidobacteraceae bacterium]
MSVPKTGKILVVEDDPEARELLVLLLAGADYRVIEAADGLEALQLARREHPDLLITDIVMPRMDGYELVRHLRDDSATAETPVIFCSASYHERDVRAMARSLGVMTTLAKPYDIAAVRSTVKRALEASSHTDMSHTEPAGPGSPQATQDRLNSLVAFSRQLFTTMVPEAIPASACRAAREILMAQCAHLVVRIDGCEPSVSRESGLTEVGVERLLAAPLYKELIRTVEDGGCALYPMVPPAPAPIEGAIEPGEFVSLLGVPIASSARVYGHLCVVNRIGLSGFTEEDLAVARAIAAQVAVACENVTRHNALAEQIAQRDAAEAEVRRLNQDLERRVAERTAELEIANRELEAFSYSVAHDLRSPLRLIDAHVQMLRDEEELASPNAVSHMDHIRRGASQMSALIDGLLALSRVSHVEMKQEFVPLNQLVDQALDHLEQERHMRSIEWQIAKLPTVRCDPALMRQVFVNLIGNSLKYTRLRRGARIEIGVGTAEDTTYVYVRDNGVGFDMRYANKLFGVFQRLHHPSEFEGTGIGLATVSRIIERHGGRIWADSTLGQGATFRFTLGGMPKV